MTSLKRQMAALFSATALSAPALTAMAQTEPVTLPADNKDTITFKVLTHKIGADGNASLLVDAGTLDENKLAVAFDVVTKAAILMPGIDNKRACPYVDLKRYQHSIDQTEPGKFSFQITAKLDPQDAKRTLDSQCAIVDLPSVRKINWKSNPN